MVVDDEEDLLFLIKSALTRYQISVEAFSEPTKALEQFSKESSKYSLVLSDIRMPKMNGIELAKQMLKINQSAKVVLMTAYEIEEFDLSHSLPTIKKEDVIKKPFTVAKLCDRVKKELRISP